MVVPPDEFRLLSGEELSFDLRGLNAFSAWSYDHLLIAATLIQETSMLVLTPPGLLLQWRDELDEKFGLQFTLIENAAGFARVQEELPAGVNSWDALPRVLTSVDFIKKETVRNRVLRKSWDLIYSRRGPRPRPQGPCEGTYFPERDPKIETLFDRILRLPAG